MATTDNQRLKLMYLLDILRERTDKEHFEARVDVAASDLFLGWVAGLGEGVQITAPADVKDRMREMAERLRRTYEYER